MNKYDRFPIELENASQLEKEILSENLYGKIYQYVITASLTKRDKEDDIKFILDENKTCKLYFDTGSGFNEEETVISNLKCGENIFEHTFYDNIKNIRVDFGEKGVQLIHIQKILWNDKEIDLSCIRGNFSFSYEHHFLFMNSDANMYFPVEEGKTFKLIFCQDKLIANDMGIQPIMQELVSERDKLIKLEQILQLKFEIKSFEEVEKIVHELLMDHEKIEKLRKAGGNPAYGMSLLVEFLCKKFKL
ncbi:MAG: hypothetical protein RSD97_00715 [Lachnospiraceae bacterium]